MSTAFNLLFWIGEPLILAFQVRNYLVGRERRRVINEIARLGQEDIDEGYLPFWRWHQFYAVPYEKMLFSFRRVRSFYADHPALGPRPADQPRVLL